MAPNKNIPRFEDVVRALQSEGELAKGAALFALSDLDAREAEALERAWPDIAIGRRRALIEDLGELAEGNFEVDFEAIYRIAMDDEDADVRRSAITALWESEDADLIAPLLDRLGHDPEMEVRAAAASTLGRYVYMGEVEEIPASHLLRVEEALLGVFHGTGPAEVRRRALEALAFSSREDIPGLIQTAYASPDQQFRVSALFAMGRSADERWAETVLAELNNTDNEIRFEAARSAGELELERAVSPLRKLLNDPDIQIREAAVWSLGQIGGNEARQALEAVLTRTRDSDERDFIEEALENAAFHDDITDFALFELDELPDLKPELDPKKKLDDRLN